MYLEELGEIIAVRDLTLTETGKEKQSVRVIAGKPQFADSIGWYCPFQITGVGDEKIRYAAGIDAIQALQLVMVMIGANLQYQNEQTGGALQWEGDNQGGLGFPSSPRE